MKCGWWTTRPAGLRPPCAPWREAKALFQMKFYAVALLRSGGVLATRLRLIYLADGQILDYEPELDELERFEDIDRNLARNPIPARQENSAPTRPGVWCVVYAPVPCPAFGGTPPPYPGWPDSSGGWPHELLLPAPGRRWVPPRCSSRPITREAIGPQIQHGSPPLALLTKAIEELLSPGMRVGRLTLDILGAIPVTEVRPSPG